MQLYDIEFYNSKFLSLWAPEVLIVITVNVALLLELFVISFTIRV